MPTEISIRWQKKRENLLPTKCTKRKVVYVYRSEMVRSFHFVFRNSLVLYPFRLLRVVVFSSDDLFLSLIPLRMLGVSLFAFYSCAEMCVCVCLVSLGLSIPFHFVHSLFRFSSSLLLNPILKQKHEPKFVYVRACVWVCVCSFPFSI